jgi:G:T-mismatch repair DNA endonuclease (very short patch repair protein)
LAGTVQRNRTATKALIAAAWTVETNWECSLRADVNRVLARLNGERTAPAL